MKKFLLPEKGKFFKANLHVHTTVSDGKMTPEEVKQIYKSQGYSVLALTDHQILLPHPELNDDDFLTITAAEIAKNKGNYALEPSTHFNVYAKAPGAITFPFFDPEDFWPSIAHAKAFLSEEAKAFPRHPYGYSPEELNQVIAACNAAGFLICLNHPVNSFQNYSFYGTLRGLWGAECFNNGCFRAGYYENMNICDDLWREGERRVFPIASDDAHVSAECCGGWTMLKAESLTYDKVFAALENGDFYASTGVEIHQLYIENDVLYLECDGADEIVLQTPIRFRKLVQSDGKLITSWCCDLSYLMRMYRENAESGVTKNTYLRLDLKQHDGAEAHTRAYFLDIL